MTDKSYVTMEQNVCDVCGQVFDTGALLLDTRLRERFERNTVTGYGLCPEHQAKFDEGYIALVGVDPAKSGRAGDTLKREDAYRTGNVAHVRREIWGEIFSAPLPEKNGEPLPMAFVDDAVITMLSNAQGE